VSSELARPIPDKLSIWPVEGGRFGLDATFTGSSGLVLVGVVVIRLYLQRQTKADIAIAMDGNGEGLGTGSRSP
jgi:hypothetical protein